MLEKIEALLRKAERTTFEPEAAAFYAKAQELMEKYAISEESLWQSDPTRVEKPILERVEIKGDAAYEKSSLVNTIAIYNRCKAWKVGEESSRSRYVISVAGYPSDVVFVQSFYTSLLLQMNLACVVAEPGNSSRPWRISFTVGFVDRVSGRLSEQHESRSHSTGRELVLTREQKVKDYVSNELGIHTKPLNDYRPIHGGDGYASGIKAGNDADIGNTRLPGRRREIGYKGDRK